MPTQPGEAEVQQYERTLLFLKVMLAMEREFAQGEEEDLAARGFGTKILRAWQERENDFSASFAKLQSICREFLEKTRDFEVYQSVEYDAACRSSDAPTLTQMQVEYWGVIADFLERGRLQDSLQASFIRRVVDLGAQALNATEREMTGLRRLLRDFMFPDDGEAPYVRGAVLAVRLPNGRFAAVALVSSGCKLSMHPDPAFAAVAYDGFWDQQPDLSSVTERGFYYYEQSAVGLPPFPYKLKFPGPISDDFVYLGSRPFSEDELDELLYLRGFMECYPGKGVTDRLYLEWRRRFDAEAYTAEVQAGQKKAGEAKRRKPGELSLKAMARRNPFTHWREQWSRAEAAAANRIVREGANALIQLEDSGSPASDKEAVIKSMIDNFNELYEQTGCIETDEAEEVVDWVTQLASRVGLSNEDERLTGHRTW